MGDGIEVVGGTGGVAARTDDMRWHADLLDRTGDELRRVAATAATAGDADLLVRTAPLAPATAALAQASVLGADLRVAGLAVRVEGSARRLRLTASALVAADRWPRAGRQGLTEALAPMTMVVAVGAAVAAGLDGVVDGGIQSAIEATPWVDGPTGIGTADRMRAEAMRNWNQLLQSAPWLVDGVVHGSVRSTDALLSSTAVTRPLAARIDGREDLLTELLAVAPALGALTDTPVTVTPVGRPQAGAAPAALQDVVAEQQALMERAAPDRDASRVRLIQTATADGQRSWIVLVPGTQEWSLRPGGDPSDLVTNAHLTATGDAALLDAVDAAMQDAGVSTDEPVLLAGHSQGGITAAAFARQADERGYNVTHVVTQGSPVQNLPPPPAVHMLSVEHTDDPVPRLDSGVNLDLPTHVTVLADSGAPVTTNVVEPHGLRHYRSTVAAAVTSGDPSVAAFDDEVGALFLGGGEAVHHEYEAVRVEDE